MSVLVVLVPPRARLSAHAADTLAEEGMAYVLSDDGLQVSAQGCAAPTLWPKADSVVAVLADSDVSWQRLTLPKAPASRLRAALGGLLEEQLLEEDEAVHVAVAPEGVAGAPTWIAIANKAWLRGVLDEIERAGPVVDRVVPSAWPGDTPQGHFFAASTEPTGVADVMLSHADEQGLVLLRLQGSLARTLQPRMAASTTRWTATPAVAAPAERWLGAGVILLGEGERALQSARSLWNLRQFDLAPRHRGTRALRDAWRRVRSPVWRPVRLGLSALLALQVVGLNAHAWQQRQAIAERREAQQALLRSAFPGVRAVLDAPLQMQRETEALRAAAGRAGQDDLEALLGAAAAAWPEGLGPLHTVRFEPGRLSFTAPGWTENQMLQFRERLRAGGLAVESAEGRVTLRRAGAPA
jgi:general secretion pathway protein L